ncbi:hypothetical protein VST7929_02716 [Vibrio stylophorae]|uniref:Cytochrome c domain-containing protein n=2 Tax=Vibrio stylophorae TaxID=659351 RepID=A0ABN8DXG4_9VIBR|nr:hypothetical protein VST7929_02716 [Vibrio stylophorae]
MVPSAQTQTAQDADLIERIRPIGQIYVAGEVELVTAAPEVIPTTGLEVYEQFCGACHQAGIAGAPMIGDQAAWAPRLAKGKETLYQHAIGGFNAMPAKGGCNNCDDALIVEAVDHLLAALP